MVLYAKDIAEPVIFYLPRETNAFEAAVMMKEKRQGFVIVSNGLRPEGIVTEWDYLSKITAAGKDPATVTLGDIMTASVITVKGGDGVESVARTMTEQGVRRVLVVEGDKIVGVITSRTILARLEEYVDKVSTTIARLQAPPS